jgi:hypothetical protein
MRRWLTLGALAASLAACGGDDGGGEELAGIWLGAFVADGSAQTLGNLNAVVSPADHRVYFIDMMPGTSSIHARGTLSLDGDAVTSTLATSDPNGAPVGQIDLDALLVEAGGEDGLQGSYSGDADAGFFAGTGTVSFALMRSLYVHPSSLADIAGAWTAVGDTATQVTLGADGAITGGNGECVFTGQVAVFDPDYNLAGVDLAIASCDAPWDGAYTGLLYGTADDEVTLVVSKADFGFVLYLER